MPDIVDALLALDLNDWTLDDEPTNESEFNQMFKKGTGKDADNNAILSSDPLDFGVTWSQISTKLNELNNAEPLRLLREERDKRLAETDWWAGSDLTMTQAQTNYRQALRDITNTYSDLDTVVWPTKP